MIPKQIHLLAATALLLSIFAEPGKAQSTGDGSLYSAFGVGELTSYGSSQVQALGGGGVGIRSLNYANFANPASLSDQVLARIAGGMQFQSVAISDAQNNTSRLNQGTLNAIQLSFPIIERQLGVGFALSPYSRVGYRVREEGSLTEPDTVLYGVDSEGRGGLQIIEGAVGYRISDAISLGASLGYMFGILEEGRRTFFPSGGHRTTTLTNATRLGGVTASLGTQVSVPGPASGGDQLTFGASFTLPVQLSGDRVRTVGESLDRDTLRTVPSVDADLPWSLDAGVAYRLDNRWLFAVGGTYAPWSNFTSSAPFGGYSPDGENLMRDRVRLSGGFEVLPAGGDQLASFLARTGYRLGAYMDQSYVNPVAGADLVTYAVTAGLSLPALFSGTRLDINMEVGTRGNTENDLVRDLFYRLSASVNIGERWFEQRKLR